MPDDAEVVAAWAHDDAAVLFYRADDWTGHCTFRVRNDRYRVGSASTSRREGGHRDRPDVVHVSKHSVESGPDQETTIGTLRVSGRVDRVRVGWDDRTAEAHVEDDVAVFWVPREHLGRPGAGMTFTAFGRDGSVLDRGSL